MLELIIDRLPTFSLYLVRVAAMIVATPFFGVRGDSKWPRVVLIFVISLLLYLPSLERLDIDTDPLNFALLVGREATLGLGVGFALHAGIAMLRVAGGIIGQEMGFGFAQVANPASGETSTVMAQIFEALVFLTFLALDGLHACLRILKGTFAAVPVGSPFDLERMARGLEQIVAAGFDAAVTVAFPVFGVILVSTVTMMLVARAAQQLNVMEFAFTLRILMALVAITWFLGLIGPNLVDTIDRFLGAASKVIRP